MSLGADADTLGAIVGGIAEAIWGIPEWMKKKAVKYLPDDMREILNEFRKTSVWHLTKTVKDEQAKQEAEELNQFKAIMFWKLSLGNPTIICVTTSILYLLSKATDFEKYSLE